MSTHNNDPSNRSDRPQSTRTRVAYAMITGILAGAARALTNWLFNHLTDS